MLLSVRDYKNVLVILAKHTWFEKILDPIFGHPEVKLFLGEIKATINDPDYVYRSIRDPRSKLFYAEIASGKFASYFLCIVVKYIQEQKETIGYVSTVMINKKLPIANKPIWQRKK